MALIPVSRITGARLGHAAGDALTALRAAPISGLPTSASRSDQNRADPSGKPVMRP